MSLCEVGCMRCNFISNHSVLYVLFVRQTEMFLWRDVTEHGAAVPADHGRTDGAGYMIVAGRDVGRERAERVEWRFVTPFELFLHVLFDHVHGNVARAFVHYLHMMRPRALGELALRIQFSELRLIICVSNTAWPQAVANGKADVIRGHDLANFVPVRIEKTFLMMRKTPLGHDRAAARNDFGRTPC